MAVKKLTISEVSANSADFLYIFADEDAFLSKIPAKYANVIRYKKANQNKLLMLSANEYGSTYNDYAQAVRSGFVNQYGIEPKNALAKLAMGETVAGKNWSEGVYGIGKLRTDFNGVAINDQPITVNTETGHIFMGTTDITNESKTVYKTINKKTVAFQLFGEYKDSYGKVVNTFMSQYNKTQKKYGAYSYTEGEDGTAYRAKDGKQLDASDNATVWASITMSFQTFLEWLVSLFAGNVTAKEQLSSSNTLPNQKTDGFVTESGFGEAGLILVAVAAGTLLMSGGLKKKKK